MKPLILAALRLPDSSAWPPDYYTLLGLTPETSTPEAVELAVLDRMERLRAYQLAHPDEVTAAMNLLARALGELADQKAEARSGKPRVSEPNSGASLVHVPPAPADRSLIPEPRSTVSAFCYHPSEDSAKRRKIREVVAARKTLDAWDAAGPFFTATAWQPPTRFAAVEIIAALRMVAAMLPEESEEGPGGSVLALARTWPGTQTLMEMSEARRELLGNDWRAGRWELLDQVRTARKRVRRQKVRRAWNLWKLRWQRRTPQMLVGSLAILAVVVVIYRWLA